MSDLMCDLARDTYEERMRTLDRRAGRFSRRERTIREQDGLTYLNR